MSCFQSAWENESIQAWYMEMIYSLKIVNHHRLTNALLHRHYTIKLSNWYSNHVCLEESDLTILVKFKINFVELQINYILQMYQHSLLPHHNLPPCLPDSRTLLPENLTTTENF